MDDLRGIVAAAIHMHDEERQLIRWEVEVEHAEATLPGAGPAFIAQLCQRLSVTYATTRIAFEAATVLHAEVRRRAMRGTTLEGGAEIVAEQARDAERLGERLVALRGRLRALDGAIGDALAEMRDQSIGDRLLRLALPDAPPRTLKELQADVSADHAAIADAMGDWRLMHSGGAVITIADSTSPSDLQAGLAELVRAGRAIRHGSGFVGYRWIFPAATPNSTVSRAA